MLYQITCDDTDNMNLLMHKKAYTQKEVNAIIKCIKFENPNIEITGLLNILCEDYNFYSLTKIT